MSQWITRKRSLDSHNGSVTGTIIVWTEHQFSQKNTMVFRHVHKIAKATISFVMSAFLSVCPSDWNNSAPTGQICIRFDIWVFFGNLSGKSKFHKNLTRIAGTLHEDQCKFMIKSCSFLLRMRNVSDKRCGEIQNTYFRLNNFFFRKSYRLWDSVQKYLETGRLQMAI